MVIVLNQFINLQQPSDVLPSKIKSRSFHHCTLVHRDGKAGEEGGKKKKGKYTPISSFSSPKYPIAATGHMRMLLKQLSKHALTSLTPHPKASTITLSLKAECRDFLLSIASWWRLGEGGIERLRQNKSLSSFTGVCVYVCAWLRSSLHALAWMRLSNQMLPV